MALRESSLERAPFLPQDGVELEEDKESIMISTDEKHCDACTFHRILRHIRNIHYLRHLWSADGTSSWKSTALNFASFFIPSFLRRSTERRELHETAYLDGVRGYACYAVFLSHYLSAYCNEVWHSYGEGLNHHLVQTSYVYQLPIIRLMYNGQAAVSIFFILSGYVLSYKPLKLMHSRDFDKLQSNLASAIFRRWFRLFLPVAALWIINIFLVQFGAFSWFNKYREENPKMPPGIIETYLAAGESFWGTVYNAGLSFWRLSWASFFQWSNHGIVPIVDGHTWTLHVEYRSSCLLFLFLLGCSRMRANLRLVFFIFTSAFCLCASDWPLSTFLAGSVFADLDLRIRRRQALSQDQGNGNSINLGRPSRVPLRLGFLFRSSQFRWALLLFFSLFILSYPTYGAVNMFFYRTLAKYTPAGSFDIFFWQALGANLVVYAITRLPLVQKVLEWRVSQYMGKTSFALYLCHGSIVKTLGHWSVIHMWKFTGYSGWGYALGILIPMLWIWPATIIAADWFWRGVDIPSVKLARWIERSVSEK